MDISVAWLVELKGNPSQNEAERAPLGNREQVQELEQCQGLPFLAVWEVAGRIDFSLGTNPPSGAMLVGGRILLRVVRGVLKVTGGCCFPLTYHG